MEWLGNGGRRKAWYGGWTGWGRGWMKEEWWRERTGENVGRGERNNPWEG